MRSLVGLFTLYVLIFGVVNAQAQAFSSPQSFANKGKGQRCLVWAESAVIQKFPAASHNSDNADTPENFLFYWPKNGCLYDVNVSVQDKFGKCVLGEPTLDKNSKNCN